MDKIDIHYDNEIWKPVLGFEGYYEVSTLGRVRSVSRLVQGEKRSFYKKGKILNPSTDTKGYKYIKTNKDFCKREERKNYRIHRWVISSFLGYSELTVDHINGIRTDNRLLNLRYLSNRQNILAKRGKPDDDMYLYYIKPIDGRKERWIIYIYNNQKRVYVGSRNCKEKARKLRDDYIRENNINCFGVTRNG
jgi:hypothetical protein